MAGVQIPTLQKEEPVGEAPAPRLEASNVPNVEPAMAEVAGKVDVLGNSVTRLMQKEEHDVALSTGRDAQNQIQDLHNRLLYGYTDPDTNQPVIGLKYKDGNPTDIYKDYDTQIGDLKDKLLSNPDQSDYTKKMVNKYVAGKLAQVHQDRLQVQGLQQAKYEQGIVESNVKLEQQNYPAATSNIDLSDAEHIKASKAGIDDISNRIRQANLEYGVKMGSVVPDEEGNTFMTDSDGKVIRVKAANSVLAGINQDIGDGLLSATQNLAAVGEVDKAKFMREQYGDLISASKHPSANLTDHIHKAEIKNKALLLTHLVGQSANDPAKLQEVLNKLPATADGEEIAEETTKRVAEQASRLKNLQQVSYKAAMNTAMGAFVKRQQSGMPYAGEKEMTDDPVIANVWNQMSSKDRKTMLDLQDKPKTTPPAKAAEIVNLFAGRDPQHDLRKMDSKDVIALFSGQSPKDFDASMRRYQAIVTETNPQQQSRYKNMASMLGNELADVSYIHRNQFGNLKNLSAYDQKLYDDATGKLFDQLDQNNHPMNMNEMKQYVHTFAAKLKAGIALGPPANFEQQTGHAAIQLKTNDPVWNGKPKSTWYKAYLQDKTANPKGQGPANDSALKDYANEH